MIAQDLFDRPAPSQRHSATSRAAADAIEMPRQTLRDCVYNAIEEAGQWGLTDEQICERTGLNPSTARPRRVELERAGRVKDSGRRRATASGRAAVVWIA